MLLLLILLQGALPPIHVTVQQPPGLPFWETAIISAVVGTFFGIASGIGMEFVKPAIATLLLRKTATRHLIREFLENYSWMLGMRVVIEDAMKGSAEQQDYARSILDDLTTSITTDRYDHYLESHKSLFYDIDKGYYLGKFYRLLKTLARAKDLRSANALLTAIDVCATEFEKLHGLQRPDPMPYLLNIYRASAKA